MPKNIVRVLDAGYPPNYFKKLGGLKQSEVDWLSRSNPHINGEDGMFVFASIRVLNEEIRRYKAVSKGASKYSKLSKEDTLDNARLDLELKHERTIKERLGNQIRLGLYITKEEATDRVANLITTLKSLVSQAIHMYASSFEFKRKVVQDLSKSFNNAVDYLEKEAEVVSWESDQSAEVLRTRVAAAELKLKEALGDDED